MPKIGSASNFWKNGKFDKNGKGFALSLDFITSFKVNPTPGSEAENTIELLFSRTL